MNEIWRTYEACRGLARQLTDEELALPAALERLGRHAWHRVVALSQDEARELAAEAVRVETLRCEVARLRGDVDGLLAACEALLGWANIQDHHSLQTVQVRNDARAAIRKAKGNGDERD